MARNRGRGRGRPDDAPDKRPSAESVTSRPPPAKRRTDVRIVGAVAVGAAALGALAIALPRARAPAASGGDGACPCDLDAWAPPPDAAELVRTHIGAAAGGANGSGYDERPLRGFVDEHDELVYAAARRRFEEELARTPCARGDAAAPRLKRLL